MYLKNRGQHWLGLDCLRTLISGVPLSPDFYDEADEIIKEIAEIESSSHKEKGILYCDTGWMQQTYRNRTARKQFNSILRRITQILQAEGYFDILLGKQRNPITPISTLDAETSKPSDEALPERLKEDME